MKGYPVIKKTNSKGSPHNISDYDSFSKNFSSKKAEKEIEFFSDGKLNIAYNAIDRHAKGNGKIALIYNSPNFEREDYTYDDLKVLTNKFANVLESLKVKKGDRVFIFLPTIPERYIVFMGILKMGAIAGTLFSAFQEMALLDRLSDSKASVLITNAVLYPRIEKIWKDLPHLKKIIIIERGAKDLPGEANVVYYSEEMDKAKEDFAIVHMEKGDPSYMLYTSGTTGKPKGVVHAHYDILHAILTTKYVLDVQKGDIYWCSADIGWVTGVVYGTLGIWGLGGTSVIFEGKFSPENWYRVIEENKVTVWYTAPTAIRMLMGASTDIKKFDLSSLRHLASVGEPLNPEAVVWGEKAFGLPFHDTWWQTELGGMAVVNFPCLDIKPGSMGKPFPGVMATVVDDEGNKLGVNKEGHLVIKPMTISSLMKEVWGNKEKFDSYFKNGWYISGDKAFVDEDGYFWFLGRADDVIKTSGERVGPFEVESALVEFPDIIEAGVIGKPDKVRMEIIKAFVVLKPETVPSEELKKEIAHFVKGKLAGHAYPREIEFIDKLPKTRSGKIMRRVLKSRELGLPEGDTSTLEDY